VTNREKDSRTVCWKEGRRKRAKNYAEKTEESISSQSRKNLVEPTFFPEKGRKRERERERKKKQ
jgi:hypothetical protein